MLVSKSHALLDPMKLVLGVALAGALGGFAAYMLGQEQGFISVNSKWEAVRSTGRSSSAIVESQEYDNVNMFLSCLKLSKAMPEISIFVSMGGKHKLQKDGWPPRQVARFEFANSMSYEAAFDRPGLSEHPQQKKSIALDNIQSRKMLTAMVMSGYVDVIMDDTTVRFFSSGISERFARATTYCPSV